MDDTPGGYEDAELTLAASSSSDALWIVTDGYAFDAGYQTAIKTGPARLLFVDDHGHCTRYVADIVLNQNLHASDRTYRHRHESVRLLLGPRYVLLRREFRGASLSARKPAGLGTRVLVTLGGGDRDNVTTRVVESLSMVPVEGLEVVVAVGPSNPHEARLRRMVDTLSIPVSLEVGVENMVPLMQWADLALCAGGSTSWEMAYMGLPSVVLVLAENQVPIAEALAETGAAEYLGWHSRVETDEIADAVGRLLVSSERREAVSRRGRELVDGLGVDRVLRALQEANLKP
jgi:UDP-2,4-diacetamido-2,4,6-trideoxy-beta-L-altropyranose hydrolase